MVLRDTHAVCLRTELTPRPSRNLLPETAAPKVEFTCLDAKNSTIKELTLRRKLCLMGLPQQKVTNTILTQKSLQQICNNAVWIGNAESLLNLNHFYETQNKTWPGFNIGSISFSLGLINSCINAGAKQETPAYKVSTHLLDSSLNQNFHCIMHRSGMSCTKLGSQEKSNSESPNMVFIKNQKLKTDHLSTYADFRWIPYFISTWSHSHIA